MLRILKQVIHIDNTFVWLMRKNSFKNNLSPMHSDLVLPSGGALTSSIGKKLNLNLICKSTAF
jgi:hypothetical protein